MRSIFILLFGLIPITSLNAHPSEIHDLTKIMWGPDTVKPRINNARTYLKEYVLYSMNTLKPEVKNFVESAKSKGHKIRELDNAMSSIILAEESARNALYSLKDNSSHLIGNTEAYSFIMSFYVYLNVNKKYLMRFYKNNKKSVDALNYRLSITNQKSKLTRFEERIQSTSSQFTKYLYKHESFDWSRKHIIK